VDALRSVLDEYRDYLPLGLSPRQQFLRVTQRFCLSYHHELHPHGLMPLQMLRRTSMAAYEFQEFPKWVGNVLVESAAEERALLLELAEGVAVAVAQPSNVPSPAAIRMQRSRERRREGKRTIPCDISTAQIEALASAGFLDRAMRDDAVEVAHGVGRMIDHLTRSGRGNV
jgi:hypothetical protein